MSEKHSVSTWGEIAPGWEGIHGLELEVVEVGRSWQSPGHGHAEGKMLDRQAYTGRDRNGVEGKFEWHGTYAGRLRDDPPLRRLEVGEFVRINESHMRDPRKLAVGFGHGGLSIIPRPRDWDEVTDEPSEPDDGDTIPPSDDLEMRVARIERKLAAMGAALR